MLSYEDSLAALMGHAVAVPEIEQVPTIDAAGRVLALDQRSMIDVPSADNTQMDGYAVRCADLAALDNGAANGRAAPGTASERAPRLRVAQRLAAGQVGEPLLPGTAARIFTGAMIPEGADAIVMQEQASADGDHVLIHHRPRPGEWIRRAGEDIRAGGVILPAGTLLSPQSVGLAAAVGLANLPVRRRIRVACFFTGDELVMPGDPLPPGTIYNSNRFVLVSLLRRLGCEVTDLGIVPDSLAATREALRAAVAHNDLIVTSGGMSIGEEDHVKPAVQAEGSLDLWQIAIKPGKPLAHGTVRRPDDGSVAQFIGLPGNPVSSFVTFLLFVRPFVRRMQGMTDVAPRAVTLRADFEWPRPDRRREFLRVRVNAAGGLDLFPNQGSAVLTSTVWADGLVDNPPSRPIARGQAVRYLPFSALLG